MNSKEVVIEHLLNYTFESNSDEDHEIEKVKNLILKDDKSCLNEVVEKMNSWFGWVDRLINFKQIFDFCLKNANYFWLESLFLESEHFQLDIKIKRDPIVQQNLLEKACSDQNSYLLEYLIMNEDKYNPKITEKCFEELLRHRGISQLLDHLLDYYVRSKEVVFSKAAWKKLIEFGQRRGFNSLYPKLIERGIITEIEEFNPYVSNRKDSNPKITDHAELSEDWNEELEDD